MISRNGVIGPHTTGCEIVTNDNRLLFETPADTIEQLLWAALKYNLDALWIAPGSIVSRLASSPQVVARMTTETPTIAVRAHCEEGKPTCIHAWAKNGTWEQRRTVRFFFPEYDERWQLQTVTNPIDLLNTVDLIEKGLGLPLDWSPGASGKATLKKLNQGVRAPWLRRVDFTGTPWLPTEEEQAEGITVPLAVNGTKKIFPDLTELDATETMFLHIYDKSYAFGGACCSVNVGAGDPIHQAYDDVRWDKKYPGIWKVGSGKWLYTPEVNYLISENYLTPTEIREAYFWPEYHQTMRSFAELFWDLEIAAKDHPHARRAGKQIRSQGLGWLAMDTRQWRDNPEEEKISDFYRPDIWDAIVSEASVKMRYKMNQLWRKGYNAIWWNFDELGFLSNDPNPMTAVPIIDREGMGAFRHRYTLRVDDDILLAFADGTSFPECHALLLEKWRAQQRVYMDKTIMVPVVSNA